MHVSLKFKEIIKRHDCDINSVKISKYYLFSGSGDKDIRAFTRTTDDEFIELDCSPLKIHKYYVNVLSISYNEQYLASGSTDTNIAIWEISTGNLLQTFSHPSKTGIRALQFSWNSRLLASGSEDGSICLWSLLDNNWRLVKLISEYDSSILTVLFTPDSEMLITGASNGYLRLWECRKLLSNDETPRNFLFHSCAHDLGVYGSSMSPIFLIIESVLSFKFVTCGGDDKLKTWNLQVPRNINNISNSTLKLDKCLVGHSRIVQCCEYSSDGLIICSVSMDHCLIIWDAISGLKLYSVEVDDNYVSSCSISWDNKYVVTGGNDKSIKLWHLSYSRPDFDEAIDTHLDKFNKLNDFGKNHSKLSHFEDRVLLPLESVDYWTCEQVVMYLSEYSQGRLSRYSKTFMRHANNGQAFLSLTDHDLSQKLQIEIAGDRKLILKIIEDINMINKKDKGLYAKPKDSASRQDLPHEVYCPITHEIMYDPVVASDGISYERRAIQLWFNQSKSNTNTLPRSPITNEIIDRDYKLIPNLTLRKIIKDLVQYE